MCRPSLGESCSLAHSSYRKLGEQCSQAPYDLLVITHPPVPLSHHSTRREKISALNDVRRFLENCHTLHLECLAEIWGASVPPAPTQNGHWQWRNQGEQSSHCPTLSVNGTRPSQLAKNCAWADGYWAIYSTHQANVHVGLLNLYTAR